MAFLPIIALAVGLSMDAFAVAICKGLAMKKLTFGKAAIVGVWFGLFQAGMPLIGYFALTLLKRFIDIEKYDHWITLALLLLIGGNMIREALSKKEEEPSSESLRFGNMLMLALATSIDAMASGATLPDEPNVFLSVAIIGVITFGLSMLGVKIGNLFGAKYEKKAELAGGIILILLGIYYALEGCGVIDMAVTAVKNLFNIA